MGRDFGFISWSRFVDFVNVQRMGMVEEIKALQRMGMVEQYQQRFLALSRCEELTTQHMIDLFTGGLGHPLASDIELQHLTNLQTAMSFARACKHCRLEASSANSTAAPKPSSCCTTALTSTVASGVPPADS